ncbi:MAG: carbohydrate ABC transporter permease [Elusimicrobiota bacterium]|nr:carbohydrate ABC transporter permease [Elusimicrobiota bacterium]
MKTKNITNIIVLTIAAVFVLLPLYWLFVTAFTPEDEITRMPPRIIPARLTLQNFNRLLFQISADRPLLRWFFNSLYIAVIITVICLFISSLAAYAFARKNFIGGTLLFSLFIGTMMIPGEITMVPLYLLMKELKLIDSHLAIILPALPAPFAIFMLKQFIQELPVDMEEAAKLDGCNDFQIYFRIVLPLMKPALTALGIFIFITQWNMFIWPLIVLNTTSKFTLQVGLATLQEQHVREFGLLMAGAAIASIPIIIVFFSFQRFLIRGLGSMRT